MELADSHVYHDWSTVHAEVITSDYAGHRSNSTLAISDEVILKQDNNAFLKYRSGQGSHWKYVRDNDINAWIEQVSLNAKTIQTVTESESRPSTLVNKINELRSIYSLIDEELASILGTSRKTLHNWVNGNTKPNKNKLNRLLHQHKLAEKWVNNGYPTATNLDPVDKQKLLSMLEETGINEDEFLYFGSGIMLSSPAQEIDNPFA